MEKWIVDRVEGGFAVCEYTVTEMVNLELVHLPSGVKEGDVLVLENDEFVISAEDTEARREVIQKKMDALFVD